MSEKNQVKDFWNEASCGEELYLKGDEMKEKFYNQSKARYELEPYILTFADFKAWKDKKVLEIGVGLGSDHQKWAEAGSNLYGIDLTERAVNYTKERFSLYNLTSNIQVGDAENLPFDDMTFDLVYSWGVIHHSPNTPKAVQEIFRTLKNNGTAKIMIYYKHSMVGYMLWLRYALLKFKPFTSLNEIYSKYLESPGTKAYNYKEAKQLFSQFREIKINTLLTHGDLLTSNAGQRHQGLLLNIARTFFPRKLIQKFFPKNGLFMLIQVKK